MKLFSKKCRGLLAAATIAGLLSFLGTAGIAKSIDLTTAQGFKTLEGEFTQVSSKGNVSKGVFIISKPGKMRFEYASPNPFIIVSDGTWVTVKNRAKDKAANQAEWHQTDRRLEHRRFRPR